MDDMYLIRGDTLTEIADAIREKTGGTDGISAGAFADEIGEIETGGGIPEKGLVFEDYDSDGYPHSARFVGTWTNIPNNYCRNLLRNDNGTMLGHKIKDLIIPDGVLTIGEYAFYNDYSIQTITFPLSLQEIAAIAFNSTGIKSIELYDDIIFSSGGGQFGKCSNLITVIFGGDVNAITNLCFQQCSLLSLIDFSHCTSIPPLYSVTSLGHAPGCVIRIPAALSDTTLGEGNGFESETNWSALTDIVWEVV